jgi:hypothetical protein
VFAKHPVSRSLLIGKTIGIMPLVLLSLLSAHPWALRPSTLLPILPLPAVHF